MCHQFAYASAWKRWTLKAIQSTQVKTERDLKLFKIKKIVSW
jgi:hypothetical protein